MYLDKLIVGPFFFEKQVITEISLCWLTENEGKQTWQQCTFNHHFCWHGSSVFDMSQVLQNCPIWVLFQGRLKQNVLQAQISEKNLHSMKQHSVAVVFFWLRSVYCKEPVRTISQTLLLYRIFLLVLLHLLWGSWAIHHVLVFFYICTCYCTQRILRSGAVQAK